MDRVLTDLLRDLGFEFPVERAVYLTVLHRLFESGSDRAADKWRRDVSVPGAENLGLHHLYRAMRWLGDHKDAVEETLFRRRRDLFTDLSLAFFDATSLYFEGRGGESLGQFGYSKDHRPDRRQMIVGAVLTGNISTVDYCFSVQLMNLGSILKIMARLSNHTNLKIFGIDMILAISLGNGL
ncbi:MAG: hypothetical protein KKD99_00485 [Proteobacteria bacterium]|nr:hypothetical protein [Pseudomonadota bacterium]